jgi:tRNA (adenine22-N1)-methyltransferase
MKLSNRLELVVSFADQAETAADIGTDHGHVPVELVRRGIVKKALAMDVRKGPLGKAEENIRAAGLTDKIELRLSDGMEKLKAGEADVVIIAGMGGELMIHILEQGRHMWDSVSQWVLSPHSELARLRRWLASQGFSIKKEAMVFEDGKYYTVLDVRKGRETPKGEEREERSFRYGTYLIERRDPVLLGYLKDEEEKLTSLKANLEKQAEVSQRARESLLEVEEKLAYNQEVQHEMQGDH